MSELVDSIRGALEQFEPASVVDILIIAAIFYIGLLLLRRTTGMAILRGGVTLLLAVFVLASVLDLTLLDWLLRTSWPAFLIIIPIVFQPDIRRALERVGRAGHWATLGRADHYSVLDALVETCRRLSENRHGAIIVLERETGLEDYIDTGIRIDAALSAELLLGIFYPNSPLHDGAVIIRGTRIAAAGCTLPLAEKTEAVLHGTRRRAARGITETTDAIAVVVSEETGQISAAASGHLLTDLDSARLRALLMSLYTATGRLDRAALRRVRV